MDNDDKEFTISAGDDMSLPLISPLTTEQIKALDFSDLNLDTISIDTSIDTSLNNYGSGLTGAGQYAAAGSYMISNNGTGPSWNSLNYPSITVGSTFDKSLSVKGDAEFDGDVKIQGHSILHLLKKIEDRLAVLQEPDPEKLEKFAALKKAYDHYKTLERLIGEE